MADSIIALLPDHVANQIAAGEVVQRPASVVKELLENAIDAGATSVKLIVKEAGKSLIQVIDNGKGMGAVDARLCFERHATSKIRGSDDLFRLTTKGFRGEALASIAAVSQMELKTRTKEEETGRSVIIEGGKFISLEECQCPAGSSFTVKNLFFNIPARRNFLKNDTVEQKHILDEFERVAVPHTEIQFSFISNGNEIVNLPPGNLMQRIKLLFGSGLQNELVPVEENTSFVNISGYVGKPSAAAKVRKEQFLFVNGRFIKSPFLNHAIYEAYKELIGFQSHPRFFIFLELDPKYIDINIHPTKTEIKFTDERTVYMLLLSAVKRGLGKANAGPQLDFEGERGIDVPVQSSQKIIQAPTISVNPDYNPFNSTSAPVKTSMGKQQWEKMFEGFKGDRSAITEEVGAIQNEIPREEEVNADAGVFQMSNRYIVTAHRGNLLVIDQQRAHERIIYEYYVNIRKEQAVHSQQLLFPEQLEMSAGDFSLTKDLLDEFKSMGFDLDVFGKNSIVVNGAPADLKDFNIVATIEGILETYKLNAMEAKVEKHENLSKAIARNTCIRNGKSLQKEEMRMLVENLFNCENPLFSPFGKPVMLEVNGTEIEKFFRK